MRDYVGFLQIGSQIPFTYSYLSTKLGVFPMKYKGDMHDSLKHVLTLCYHSYLSI